MDIRKNYHNKHVIVLGVNHTSSKAVLRDRVAFNGDKKVAALQEIRQSDIFLEGVVLSTCNRVEIYAVVENPTYGKELLLSFFASFQEVDKSLIEKNSYYYSCEDAVKHLYRVVSSLNSMVIGEYQILGQVKDAYKEALDHKATGVILNKLFHLAVEAGKRIRTDTDIGKGAVSISSVAIRLAEKILGNLDKRSAMIIGAGEMSKLMARHLKTANVKTLYFTNRTRESAELLAEEFDGEVVPFEDKFTIMKECDIVLSSTGAPGYILQRSDIEPVMKKRSQDLMFFIDIAAPRDIDPDIGEIDNAFVYGIDELTMVVDDNTALRTLEIKNAELILNEELQKYYEWYDSLQVLPTLILLRQKFEDMCEEELTRYSSTVNNLPEESQKVIKQFASSLTKKYLRIPTQFLKEKVSGSKRRVVTDSVCELFGLVPEKKSETEEEEVAR